MTTIQNSFETGTAGASFTSSSSSGADTNAAAVALGTGSSATYSSTKGSAQSGTLALALGYTSSTGYAEWNFSPATTTTRVAFRLWVWYPAGGGLQRLLIFRNSGNIAYVSVEAAGYLSFTDAGATEQITSGSTPFPTNTWTMVQGAVTIGTTTANGVLELQWSTAASPSSTVWSGSASSANLGTSAMTAVRVGMSSAATATHTTYFDDFLTTDSLPVGLPGPASGGTNGAASFTTTGVLSVAAKPAASRTAALATTGVLSTAVQAIIGGTGVAAPALSGSGLLTTAQVVGPKRSVSLATTGTLSASATGHLKVFVGNRMKPVGTRYYDGTGWLDKPVKKWTGTAWVRTSY